MKSCMWTPWALETAVGSTFDGAAIEGALTHLRAATQEYEVAVWILNGGTLEGGFNLGQIMAALPKLRDIKETTKVRRIVLVTSHIFGQAAIEPLEQELGIRAYLFASRDEAHRWVLSLR